MVYLIDPRELIGKKCPEKVEPCTDLCLILNPCVVKPLYGIDPVSG